MHPKTVSHQGSDYDLTHLGQKLAPLHWHCRDSLVREFSIRIRFADHCYTETLNGAPPAGGSLCITVQRPTDISSQTACDVLSFACADDDFLLNPGSPIAQTAQHNWSTFVTSLPVPLAAGEKYFIFLTLRPMPPAADPTRGRIDLFIESAYPKTTPVKVFERRPFGRVIEDLILPK